MQSFTGFEYLLIDAANNAGLGLDKVTFPKRIEWALENLNGLEGLYTARQWKERPLYIKAVQAIRKAQRGEATGHLVGLDAICSGMQIMSATTGCVAGATATGLVDQDRRADAYTDCTVVMNQVLRSAIQIPREKVKDAMMPHYYGSKAEPKKLFGEDSPELQAFYRATYIIAPGASLLLGALLDSWQPWALAHSWTLPDGGYVRVKVMQKVEDCRIEIDELGHSTFTYEYYVNQGEARGVKNAANVVHSIDAYVLRCMVRRCSYNAALITMSKDLITAELLTGNSRIGCDLTQLSPAAAKYMASYAANGMVDPVILEYLTPADLTLLPTGYLRKMNTILDSMLAHKPFDLVTIHDQFSAHPNNLNHVRYHYKEILADLAESEILSDILSQIHGVKGGKYKKLSNNLGQTIRQSNYALC